MTDKAKLVARMLEAFRSAQSLLGQINQIEADTRTSNIEKLAQIRKIRQELNKISADVDEIQRQFTLDLNKHQVN